MKNCIKKVLILILIFICSISLFSCTSQDYKAAIELYNSGDYETASVFFQSTVKYKDSAEKLEECKYYLAKMAIKQEKWDDAATYLIGLDYLDSKELLEECYKHTNQDYAFLDDLKTLFTYRLHQATEDGVSTQALTATEYKTLKKYDEEFFHDIALKEIASTLIKALEQKNEAYEKGKTSLNECQAELYQAEYKISLACTLLYENYEFLVDDDLFVKSYVNTLETNKHAAEGSKAIYEDLQNQLKALSNTGTPWTKSNHYVKLTVKNNTSYCYTLVMNVSFYDSTGTSYYNETQKAKLQSGQSYTFTIQVNSGSIYQGLTYDYSYQDIA